MFCDKYALLCHCSASRFQCLECTIDQVPVYVCTALHCMQVYVCEFDHAAPALCLDTFQSMSLSAGLTLAAAQLLFVLRSSICYADSSSS